MNKYDVFETKFAQDIFKLRYSLEGQESWKDTSRRCVESVCGQYLDNTTKQHIYDLIYNRIFIPGGRYLASSGKSLHMICNCFALFAEDSREGWADILQKVTMMLSTGGGVGIDYSKVRKEGSLISRTGSKSSGPISLMKMINEIGRQIRSGGDRRSALWAGLHWNHGDVFKFINSKNRSILEQTILDNDALYPMMLDGTNISVIYDSEFFRAIEDKNHEFHKHANEVWEQNCKQAFSTAEPGMCFNFLKDAESGRNACQPAFAKIITENGIRKFKDVNIGDKIWAKDKWTTITNKWSNGIKPVYKYIFSSGTFIGTDYHKVCDNGIKKEVNSTTHIDCYSGPELNLSNVDTQDTVDGLVIGDGGIHKASGNLIGLYIGNKDGDYFDSEISKYIIKHRPEINDKFYEIKTTITVDELPKTYKRKVPDRFLYGDLNKRCGFLRGLFSANGSIIYGGERISLKQTSIDLILDVQSMLSSIGIKSYITVNKSKINKFNNGFYEMKQSYDLNISSDSKRFFKIIGFIQKYKSNTNVSKRKDKKYINSKLISKTYIGDFEVFDITVDDEEHVYWTGGCLVSNCTEYITEDDSDSCNLGTIYINRIRSKEEMRNAVKYANAFLICGGIYTDLPTLKCRKMRNKNNNIGLGLGGIAEWMIMNGCGYSVSPELHKLLNIWEQESNSSAYMWAKQLGVSIPKFKRAIAPNGTTSIIAETTGGIEPIFCKAYKRKYYDNGEYKLQYVVDGAVKRLLSNGIPIDQIVDAYDVPFKHRVKVQSDFQNYTDMGISSTCNMPSWGSEENNEISLPKYSKLLLSYAKRLRGFTIYPDGCRNAQPLTRCDIKEALENEGKVFEYTENTCKGGICGI